MEIEFVKLSPTQNMTVLVKTPVPREKQLEVGERLIKYSSVYAEQAGFIERPQNPKAEGRLQMMAGEFCGNGAMAAAAYLAFKKGILPMDTVEIPLEVSGAEELITCRIEALESGYMGTVKMPLPLEVRQESYKALGLCLPTVYLPGIRHIIADRSVLGDNFKTALEGLADALKAEIEDDAFGIIVFDEKKRRIDPLVIVKSAGSLCWERGCGSGSEAVGLYLSSRDRRSVNISLKQPGGEIGVSVEYENGIKHASITGKVDIAAEGTAYI